MTIEEAAEEGEQFLFASPPITEADVEVLRKMSLAFWESLTGYAYGINTSQPVVLDTWGRPRNC